MKKDAFCQTQRTRSGLLPCCAAFYRKLAVTPSKQRADANVLIVKTAIESATERPTVLVGDDTDLIVLLFYLTQPDAYDLHFRLEPKANSRQSKVWNIKQVKAELGHAICHNMLFLHAVLGCDTTSCPCQCSTRTQLDRTDVATAGENALVALYGGSRKRASTVSVTADTMRKWPLEVVRCNRRTCPQRRQQLDTTASECSCRWSNGRAGMKGCHLKTGVGSWATFKCFPWRLTYRLLRSICWRWSGVTARLILPRGAPAVSMASTSAPRHATSAKALDARITAFSTTATKMTTNYSSRPGTWQVSWEPSMLIIRFSL